MLESFKKIGTLRLEVNANSLFPLYNVSLNAFKFWLVERWKTSKRDWAWKLFTASMQQTMISHSKTVFFFPIGVQYRYVY